MFKSTRWRSEKNKIKVVFKLQFHATQVPQLAKDALMVSLVPVEIGKPTARLEKSAIQDGTCRWESPVYETVKFVQDQKTGRINEKLYYFVVSTGSSKSGILGEVSVNFADYFDAIKPSSLALPLKASKSGAILHITLQRMYGAVDQRDAEENGITTTEPQDTRLRRKFSDSETDENRNCNAIDDAPVNRIAPQITEANGAIVVYKSSDGISASGSESSSERNTPRDIELNNNIIRRGSGSFLSSLGHNSMPQHPTTNAIVRNYLEHQRSNTDWSVGSAPDGSVDDSTNSSDENLVKDRSPHASDASVEKLKSDLVILARQAEVSDIEIQTLRKQIVKESKRGQDLSREIISLKEEKDSLKQECEQLKASCRHNDVGRVSTRLVFESDDPYTLLQEIRQELNHEKDLNANLCIQLQKTQESNNQLLLAVQDLEEMLDLKSRDISYDSNRSSTNEHADKIQDVVSNHETDEDEDQKALESLVKEHVDAKETYLLEQKIVDLYSEIEVYRRDRDELEMQMEQLALDYEILKQENHDYLSKLEQNDLQDQLKTQYECSDSMVNMNELETQVESLEDELKKQEEKFSSSLVTINELKSQVESAEDELKNQEEKLSSSLVTISELKSQIECAEGELKKQEENFSASLVTISELKCQVECLEKELEKQAEAFEADLDAVMHAKVEQEKRAIRAEEALRKTRLINANTAERLQEEFRRLSTQMASTFDANERLAKKAVTEANELRLQKSHLEEMLEKADEDLAFANDHYEEKLKDLSNKMNLAKEQREQALLEVDEKSNKLEQQKEREEEMRGIFSNEVRMLRDEIEKLTEDKSDLSIQAGEKEKSQAEVEKLRASITELELLVQSGNMERNKLDKSLGSLRKEADKYLDELNSLRSIKDEKEKMIRVLESEVETLKPQCTNLKRSVVEDELEKESLRKQILNLKDDLKKNEEIIASYEKKLKAAFDGAKPSAKNNYVVPARSSKEVAGLRERVKVLEGQIRLKEAALENTSNSFLLKEKDLQYKIEELENRMVELDNTSASCFKDQPQKEVSDSSSKDEGTGVASNKEIGVTSCWSDQNGNESIGKMSFNKLLISTSQDGDYRNMDELLSEMALMKEKNASMEGELKDMEERYSEISLKFAEVEGERQQLVMTVRNLKNVKKN